MTSTATVPGSAQRMGRLWGSRPHEWKFNEDQQLPTYDAAIHRVGLSSGQRLLDLGCGVGVFLGAAAERGARVYGLDASSELLELARARVPGADLRVGDMQFLPYEDDFFDLVTSFNSIFFAADMTAALREAGRVAKPGAPVVIQVWGAPQRCDLDVMRAALRKFVPPPPAGGPALWQAGVLEGMAREAGLRPEAAFDSRWAYEYPDERTLVRSLLAAGGNAVKVGPQREEELASAFIEALAPYRTADGAYRLENEWRYMVARA
jgi:SAM-dependent methyltransferase